MAYWLNTYHPLAGRPDGPWASQAPSIPPFADASCRREPDIGAARPAITGLCRPQWVQQLREGDVVAYFTVKGRYFDEREHRRLTAVLRVIHEARSHLAADRWYELHGFSLPRNIMVPRNPPLPLEMTEGGYHKGNEFIAPSDQVDAAQVLEDWNRVYEERRCRRGAVRICIPLLVDIRQGFRLSDEELRHIFGAAGFPNTQRRPARIDLDVMKAILIAVDQASVVDAL